MIKIDKQVDEVEEEVHISGSGELVECLLLPMSVTFDRDKHYLKRCRSARGLLCLFPRNYAFDKQQLSSLLELVEPEQVELPVDLFLGDLLSEEYITFCSSTNLYKVNREKVNVESVINSNYLILDRKSKSKPVAADVLHVSVQDDEIDDCVIKELEKSRGLRTLVFNGNRGCRLEKMLPEMLKIAESLVVLDLSGTGIKQLPSSFGNLTCLRYLDLSWTLIDLLPESICDFEGLETLRLIGCSNIWRLPQDFRRLVKLKHLEFDIFGQLAVMPEGFGSLVNVQTLSAFVVGRKKGCTIKQLGKMNSIRGEFCIAMLENVESGEDALAARLQDKKVVTSLTLRWTETQAGISCTIVLESLRPHEDIEEVKIEYYGGAEFPEWIGDESFKKLTSVTLFKCEHVRVLPSLQKLPSLEYLRLDSLVSVTELNFCCENGKIAFQKLHTVVIERLLLLKNWTVMDGDFPHLVEVTIQDCPVLSELPSLVFRNPSVMKFLMVENCPLIKSCIVSEELKHIPDVCIVQDDGEDDYELL